MRIRPVGVELFLSGWTDGQRGEMRLMINFKNFAKAPKNTARNQKEQNSDVSEDKFRNTMRLQSLYILTILKAVTLTLNPLNTELNPICQLYK